jgi:hypothetical protein
VNGLAAEAQVAEVQFGPLSSLPMRADLAMSLSSHHASHQAVDGLSYYNIFHRLGTTHVAECVTTASHHLGLYTSHTRLHHFV